MSNPEQKMISELEDVPIHFLDAFCDRTAVITDDGNLVFWGRTSSGSFVDGNGKSYQNNITIPTIFEP